MTALRTPVLAAALTTAPLLAGCYTTFEIPFSEVTNLPSGHVRTVQGDVEAVGNTHSVRPLQRGGAFVLLPGSTGGYDEQPVYDLVPDPAGRPPAFPELDGPFMARVSGDRFMLAGENATIIGPTGLMKTLEVRKISPGKITALVAGTSIPVTTLALVAVVVAGLSGNGFVTR